MGDTVNERLGASIARAAELLTAYACHAEWAAEYWRQRGARLLADGLSQKAQRFRTAGTSLKGAPPTEEA
jgi:hypothetical protein